MYVHPPASAVIGDAADHAAAVAAADDGSLSEAVA